jgi:hypothetical protein
LKKGKSALTDEEKEIMETEMNLKVSKYNPQHSHKEQKESLKNLVQQVVDKRAELSNSQDW